MKNRRTLSCGTHKVELFSYLKLSVRAQFGDLQTYEMRF
jgi:hypothetical protein